MPTAKKKTARKTAPRAARPASTTSEPCGPSPTLSNPPPSVAPPPPSVGRIVHYGVRAEASVVAVAALVTGVVPTAGGEAGGVAHLTLFAPGADPAPELYVPHAKVPTIGAWWWPPRSA